MSEQKKFRFPRPFKRFWERQAGVRIPPEKRGFYEDHEIKVFPTPDIGPHFLPNREAWVTESGYFRLWHDKQGAIGLDFAQNLEDFDKLNVINVQVWEPKGATEAQVHLRDIEDEINRFTRLYEETKRIKGTLYETEPGKMWRHTALAYRHLIVTIKAYLNELDSDRLSNPEGDIWWERIVRKKDKGVNPFEIEGNGNGHAPVDAKAFFSDPRIVEELILAHFWSIVPRHLRKLNPISESDQKIQPHYHRLAAWYWFGRTLARHGVKRSLETAETVERQGRLGRRIFRWLNEAMPLVFKPVNLAASYFFPLVLGFMAFEGALLVFSLSKSATVEYLRKKMRKKKPVLKEQLTDQYNLIVPFDEILWRRKADVFTERETAYLPGPAFGEALPPFYKNCAADENEEREIIYRTVDSNRAYGSGEMLHAKRGDIATQENRIARRIMRPDGVSIVDTGEERFVFGSSSVKDFCAYPGSVITSRPSPELVDLFKQGKGICINLKNPKEPVRIMEKAAAAEMLGRKGIYNSDHCLRMQTSCPAEVEEFARRHPIPGIDMSEHRPAILAFITETGRRIRVKIKTPGRPPAGPPDPPIGPIF